ncbi:MAG TPA: ATP-binding protein [Polyangiaceae bacterium]
MFRIAMAVHELLENAIKYSLDDASQVRIEIRAGKRRISIRTDNRASGASIGAVRDMIRRIHEADDPFEFYCNLVRASAERDEQSGLGLARICAEAGLELDSDVTGDHVSITADAPIERVSAL